MKANNTPKQPKLLATLTGKKMMKRRFYIITFYFQKKKTKNLKQMLKK